MHIESVFLILVINRISKFGFLASIKQLDSLNKECRSFLFPVVSLGFLFSFVCLSLFSWLQFIFKDFQLYLLNISDSKDNRIFQEYPKSKGMIPVSQTHEHDPGRIMPFAVYKVLGNNVMRRRHIERWHLFANNSLPAFIKRISVPRYGVHGFEIF